MEQPSCVSPKPVLVQRQRADKRLTGASAIAYAAIVSFIFAVRYLDVLRWGFKLTWMVLGVTIAAELAGKTVMNTGIASQLRPRKYYTIPRETLDAAIGDVHELINFAVIESQRILFAENIWASVSVRLNPHQPIITTATFHGRF